jgi:hypothetical protein
MFEKHDIFVECLAKIHHQAIGVSAYILSVCPKRFENSKITKVSTWSKPIPVLYQ